MPSLIKAPTRSESVSNAASTAANPPPGTNIPCPVTSPHGGILTLRHGVSHGLPRSHTQTDTAESPTSSHLRDPSQATASDYPLPLAQRIASSLRRSSSALPVVQDATRFAFLPECPDAGFLQPWLSDSMPRPSSPLGTIDRKPSPTSRPSNVSMPTSPVPAQSIGSHERSEASPDTVHQSKSHRRQGSRAADPGPAPQHAAATDTFESEEVDLADLRRVFEKMQQREAHFVQRNGRRLHRHPVSAVPYPRSYDREVVDHDVWCTVWAHQLSGSVAWHLFKTPPHRVLDLGCGTGTWILDAAKSWKDTHFVGLDIVPLHPNLEEIDPILAWRVTWMQANFLERLPFADCEFDFVHVRRIARGMPEDKWDNVLEEISRVLKAGGVFQISEEDLTFPGVRYPTREDSDPIPASSNNEQSGALGSPSASSRTRIPTPSSSMISDEHEIPLSAIPSTTHSMNWKTESGSVASQTDLSAHLPAEAPINPYDHSLLEYIYNEMHAARFINLAPLSLLSNMLPLYFQGVRTHPPLVTMFPPPPHESCNIGTAPEPTEDPPRQPAKTHVVASQDEVSSVERQSGGVSSENIAAQVIRLDIARIRPDPGGKSPFVTVPQLIAGSAKYVTMDMTRYTAHAPRSLFQPNQYQQVSSPTTAHGTTKAKHSSRTAATDDFAGGEAASHPDKLPITAVKFDARTLNLHLSLRVWEVLACAEAMWDFVEACQERACLSQPQGGRAPSMTSGSDGASSKPSRPAHHATRNPKRKEVLALRRSEFDAMLRRFKFDMEDYLGFGAVLEDRLGWRPVPASRSEERQEYDAMCDAWADYQDVLTRSSGSFDKGGIPGSSTHSLPRSATSLDPRSSRGEGQQAPRGSRTGMRVSENSRPSQGEPAYLNRPHHRDRIPPHERLSRTMRLFVAFKP